MNFFFRFFHKLNFSVCFYAVKNEIGKQSIFIRCGNRCRFYIKEGKRCERNVLSSDRGNGKVRKGKNDKFGRKAVF